MTATDRDLRRRLLAAAVLTALGAGAAGAALAQSFPDRPLRLVVPFPPGGPTDIVGRPLAQLLGEALGQPVVVDNRGGAGGSIGADAVAKAAPDGYTLLMGTVGTNAINGALYTKLPHDPVRDFTPIALVASAPVAVVVNPAAPIGSIKDLIDQARAKPGSVSFGSAGNGTPGHLTGVMFASAAGVSLQHVPYKGSAPAITDLLGNQIPMMFDPLQSVIQHVRSGKLRALAISGKTRSPVLADVPTLDEAGVKDFESTAWWGVFAPAGLPADVAAKLREAVAKVVTSAAYKEKLGNLGVEPSKDPGSLAEFQKREVAKWGKAVRDSGATVN
ncbi:tripartite tricarboxylate transporter substrate binding protein [Burkholderiaceae bacterium FT117]|uniref:Bug family tripartite tricarboxylate transporter substrate binding protein n=1 Tax=Zeimonas sediminis TaxID=2944268 RepID=UPI002342C81A|nr:tripartite tricarboxylate transporter substrate binding protein [Zeimonas sediminis]MCM5569919.1 tripartite tricarboxylate transporter substrate binding protein [Zeimonas sediminis]